MTFNVEIKPAFVADVFSKAKNWNKLKSTTPVIPDTNRGKIAAAGGSIFLSLHHTTGRRQRTAIRYLKLVKVIAEAWAVSVLETTKFPPHKKLVKSSNK